MYILPTCTGDDSYRRSRHESSINNEHPAGYNCPRASDYPPSYEYPRVCDCPPSYKYQARNLLPSRTMVATSIFHGVCGIFLTSCSPFSYAGAFQARIKGVGSSAFSTAAQFTKNVDLASWHTAVVTFKVALWSAERILLLMVIWVQFLVLDITVLLLRQVAAGRAQSWFG